MKKIKETELAMSVNNKTYNDYFDRLKLISISLFTWKNLDKVAGFGASRFLELALFDYGRACFVQDKTLGNLVLNANPSDKLNIYYLPTKIMAWSLEYNKNYDLDDVVYIMNNELQKPTKDSIDLFAYRLYECERTIDININAQKTPVLLEGDTNTMLTLKNLYMQYSGNEPFIFGNKKYDLNTKLNCIKTDSPYLVDKLEIHKHNLWNDCLTFLGIDNANTDKKERMITDEVESNNELIKYYLNCFYKTRKKACDDINEKFLKDSDHKISIELNNDIMNLLQLEENDIIEMSDENVEIHNND